MFGIDKSKVEIIIAARDRTSAAFAKVQARTKALSKAAGALGKAAKAGAAVGIVAVAAIGAAAFKAASDVDKAFATIRTGTGATGAALKGLESSFKTIYTTIPASAAQAATAIADLNTRLGLTGKPLEALSAQFLNLARITGTDVAANIKSATRVMHDFDVSTKDQAGALDYLFKVSQSTGLGMTQLGNSMTQYGSVMRQMGFDINESAALLGKFEKEGVNLQLVLGSLRMGLANFAKAGEEPVEALSRVIAEIQGMGSVADANLKAIEIFGSRAGPDMAAAIREGRFEISDLMATLDASDETINKAAADALTFGDKFKLMTNKVMTLIEPLGRAIMDTFEKALPIITATLSEAGAGMREAFESISRQIAPALAPFAEKVKEMEKKISGGFDFKVIMDDIGVFIGAGLKPLIVALGWVIDKLGPLWEGLHMVGEAFHFFADKLRTEEGRLDNFKDTLEETNAVLKTTMEEVNAMAASLESTMAVPVAVLKEWKMAVDAFAEGVGSSKAAITAINAEIEKQTDLIAIASGADKKFHEDNIRYLNEQKKAIEEQAGAASKYVESVIDGTEKAIEKTEEFTVTIGDTTVSFKDAAAEVLNNADAYKKLQDSAQKLIDLDWSVFTEFEAALPNIDAGIGDMESGFVGLKGILEDNIEELENIKQAVMDINESAAPFLEAGFLKGIKAIGDFATALKDASSAIGDFSSLQDVSIEGCINFSQHVYDMVSALDILERQMEDLIPSFGKMDSLIIDIADAFLYGGDKVDAFTSDFDGMMKSAYGTMEEAGVTFGDFKNLVDSAFDTGSFEYWYRGQWWETTKVDDLADAIASMDMAITNSNDVLGEFKTKTDAWEDIDFRYTFEQKVARPLQSWARNNYNVKVSIEEVYELMKKPPGEQKEWLDDIMHSEEALTFQMDKQTNALKAQTGQLSKITEALEPYLNFMRTLNELAALSTLSTEELNNGLNSIKDTLVNLGTALSSFDLRSAMEALFSPDTGAAKGFMDVMGDYNVDFNLFTSTLIRVTEAISGLSIAMANAAGMVVISARDMETAMALIPAQLEEIEKFLMSDLWGQITAMIFAVNVEWKKWAFAIDDTDFTKVTSILSSLLGVMSNMKALFADTSEQVVISAGEIELAMSKVDDQLEELEAYLMTASWDRLAALIFAVGVEWQKDAKIMDDYLPSFKAAADTISTLASGVLSLSSSLSELRDMTVLSVRDIDKALKNIPLFLDGFVDALRLNMYEIKESLKDLDVEWQKHAEEMKAVTPSYEDSTASISKLVGSLVSLHSALESLSEMGTISSTAFDRGFSSLIESISNFAVSLSKNVDALIGSLRTLRIVWMENESVLVPLMRDFSIISDNLWGVAHNTNRMAEEFKNLSENSVTLEKGFKSLIDFINQVVKSTKEFYTAEAAAELSTFIIDVGKVIDAFVDLEIELKNAMKIVEDAIDNAVNNMHKEISTLGDLPDSAYFHGLNTLTAFVNGLIDKEPALIAEMQVISGIIHDFLGVESPTKLGPLSHLDEWPRNLIQSYSGGLEAEMHTLNSSFSALTPGIGVSSAGGNSNVNFYVTQHISDQATAEFANRDLERLMHKHAVM